MIDGGKILFDCWTHQIFVLINLQSDNSREYFIFFFFIFLVYVFVLAVQYCFSDRDYDGDCRKTPEYSVAIQLYTVRFYNYIYYQRYLNVKLYFKMFTRVASLFFPYGVFVLLVWFFFVLFICFVFLFLYWKIVYYLLLSFYFFIYSIIYLFNCKNKIFKTQLFIRISFELNLKKIIICKIKWNKSNS